jgi:LPXTG-motif cell wall-anchored protein
MALQAERASSDEPMSSATSMGLVAAGALALLGGSAWLWRRRRHAHPAEPGQTGTVE